MVKAKSPLFDKLSKGFKNLDVRLRKTGIEIGKKRIPFNPRTDAQKQHRAKYGQLVQQWNLLSPEQKQQWEQQAKPLNISGYNLFMATYLGVVVFMGLDLIKEVEITENKTYVDIDGLDINSHKFYLVIVKLKNPTGSNSYYNVFVENDNVETNYYMQGTNLGGSSQSIFRLNNARAMYLYAGKQSCYNLFIMLTPDGYLVIQSQGLQDTGSEISMTYRHVYCVNAKTNITKIRISAEVSGAIGAGSKILIFGHKA
ncbi:MAG: hypothetical protein DRJ03_24445 [Chloroflexi bacterium]|nr:MAG: hypothetical protein DRJ03_24445 [Chloroflexota bacterium]